MNHRSGVFLLLVGILLWSFCKNTTSPTVASRFVIYSDKMVQTKPYTDSSGLIILENGEDKADTYCFGSTLDTLDHLLTPRISQNPYTIRRDSLFIFLSDTSNDTSQDTSYTVVFYFCLLRTGSGTGLTGTWDFNSFDYQIIQGTIPDQDKNDLDTLMDIMNHAIADAPSTILFNGSNMISSSTSTFATFFIEQWNDTGSIHSGSSYEIQISKINGATVKLVGKNSMETVVISMNQDGDQTFSSSDTAHTAHTYYENPTSCPNPSEPVWYNAFLEANRKTAKIIAKSSQSLRKKEPEFPLLLMNRYFGFRKFLPN